MKRIIKTIIVAILTLEAKLVLKKYKPKIIGVTGSVGKTSTKDAIYAVLSQSLHVRKSEKSFNSEFGVPLTILGGRNGWNDPLLWLETIARGLLVIILPVRYPEWLILEIGADRPGDIKSICSWVKPDIAVVTRFGDVPVHVEFFKSRKALIEEKAYLPKALKRSGVLILNADDADVLEFKSHSKGHTITFGMSEEATVSGSNYAPLYEGATNESEGNSVAGLSFKANIRGACFPVIRRGIIGAQHVYPSLAALAVAVALDLNLVSATEALSKEPLPPGRMRLIPGIKGSVLIDDTYNSSPIAVEEGLKALKDIDIDGRKIAVLGDMLELGKFSAEAHRLVGKQVPKCADILVAVGVRAHQIVEGAHEAGMRKSSMYEFEHSVDAGRFLDAFIQEKDAVFIKGSQGMRMERIVEEVMAHPEERAKLLVRQDEEWMKRR